MTGALGGHDPAYLRLLWIVVSLCGITALALLVVVYRHARSRADLERAEQIIAEHDLPGDGSGFR